MSFKIPLKPYSGTNKEPKLFAVADIEAYQWTKFRLIGWYNGFDYQTFKSIDEFLEWVFEECEEEEIYFHFGGIYDFLFIIKEAISHDRYKIPLMIPRGSGLLCFDITDRETKRKISFKDTSAFLPFGLGNLTKSFNVPHKKQEFDFTKWDGKITQELEEYLYDDCRGLFECVEAYRRWPLIAKAGPKATMASQALAVYRLFMTREIRSLSDKVDEFVRQGYYGGRTEIFRPEYHSKSKKLYCYDVNSLYPYVMAENEYPTNFSGFVFKYDPKKMGFWDVKVEVPEMYLPPLPVMREVKGSRKLIFPTGTFRGVWSTVELEYARSLGVKIKKFYKGATFKNGGFIFREYINTLYKMRLEAKAKDDGVGDILCKLLMNSCYGRFGLNLDREQMVFDDLREGFKPHSEFDVYLKDKKYNTTVRIGTKPIRLDKTFSNCAISSWVTSLARVYMHRQMLPVQDHLYYMDTDSLFTTQKLPTGDGLGKMKLEYEMKKAVFLLPKTYVVEGDDAFKKLAMKGFDKRKIQHFTYDDFYTALEGDLRHMKVFHDAKFAKFKTAAKKGNLTTLLGESPRAIKSLYNKREVFKKGKTWDSSPHFLQE